MTDRDGTTHSYEYDDDGNQIACLAHHNLWRKAA